MTLLLQLMLAGSAGLVDLLEIRWPSGAVSRRENIAADRVVTVNEGRD